MAVDLSNVKVGDTVHMDCGGGIVVPEEFYNKNGLFSIDDFSWYLNGTVHPNRKSPFDIVAVTPKPEPKRIKGWLNVYYGGGLTAVHPSRGGADEECSSAPIQRLACIYIDVAEGEGL